MLSVKNLYIQIGRYVYIRNISFDVKEGEVVCLTGRNGAGKTTILKSIVGLNPVAKGSIKFRGEELVGKRPYQIARLGIGYVPDDRKVFTDLTVEENILIPLKHSKLKESERRSILETIYTVFPELSNLRSRKGLYLSGGEQRMVAIARAMALNPSLLILDEPLEGLAPIARQRLISAMRSIKKKGVSILLAESNIANLYIAGVGLETLDRVYLITRGEITGVYSAEEAFKNISRLQL